MDEKTDGLVIINATGVIMAINRAAFEAFGYVGELVAVLLGEQRLAHPPRAATRS